MLTTILLVFILVTALSQNTRRLSAMGIAAFFGVTTFAVAVLAGIMYFIGSMAGRDTAEANAETVIGWFLPYFAMTAAAAILFWIVTGVIARVRERRAAGPSPKSPR